MPRLRSASEIDINSDLYMVSLSDGWYVDSNQLEKAWELGTGRIMGYESFRKYIMVYLRGIS